MEAGGVEPPSRDVSERVSTCIVDLLSFAAEDSARQDSTLASPTIFSPIPCRTAGTGQPTAVAHIR